MSVSLSDVKLSAVLPKRLTIY